MLPFIGPDYTPGSFPYVDDGSQPVDRTAWMAIFTESVEYFRNVAAADPTVSDAPAKADIFASTYRAALQRVEPELCTCLHLCKLREDCLRNAGFTDVFKRVKNTENENALKLLGSVCAELDAFDVLEDSSATGAWTIVVQNILSGNIFDCGTAATRGANFCFQNSRAQLKSRPWAIDHLDDFINAMKTKKYTKALIFCDNSGPDFVLGMLPFARMLLKADTAESVVIAANTTPSLNDMTYDDIVELLPDVFREDALLENLVEGRRLRFVPSGSDLPVIDLSGKQNRLSQELLDEARDADLVVLEGMGRSIETNLYAEISIDSLRIGMIKHEEVAMCLGTSLKDCVVKFVEGRGG